MAGSTDALMLEIEHELDYQLYMTPVNYNEENERFLDAYRRCTVYDPVYCYRPFESSRAWELFRRLEKEPQEDTAVGQIYSRAISSLQDRIRMYETIGKEGFTDRCFSVYGQPDESLRSDAVNILKKKKDPADDGCFYSAADLERVIRIRLEAYGFAWKITVTPDMAPRVSVEPGCRTIFINSNASFSSFDMIRLQRHEIDTHVLRTENGMLRGADLFYLGTDQSLMHEEGLALYNERKYGVSDEFAMTLYAARFLVCLGAAKPFHELFDELIRSGCPESTAIYVVPRIKRGLSDTSLPGGFIKDYVYFQGMHEVSRAIEADPGLYRKMYFGSCSISDTALLEKEINEAVRAGSLMLPLEEATPIA